mmetsp:Transcript_15445/g.2581  ORF Transcript_15445/g.2581 Transcript_15445/m.2581 type:complete len:93 (+) Transcript_15445:806-1084(+)
MELRGILVAAVTIYCGLYYLTTELSEEIAFGFFVIMVLSNAYFLIYWIVYLIKASLVIVVNSIPAFRRKFVSPNDYDGLTDIIEEPWNKGYY